jgi:lactate racemase
MLYTKAQTVEPSMNAKYYLHYAPNRRDYFSLPPGWSPAYFVENQETGPDLSVGQMASDALEKPMGTPSLRDMVGKAGRIAVIVDDVTRPTPVREILDVLLARLLEAGTPPENVSIVIACGTHVAMEKSVLEARLGSRTVASYEVVQHNAWQDDLVPFEIPEDGRVVMVNPHVARAEVKIGISSILPHPMAGYGGGPKIVMPGVCGIDFIMGHHMKHTVHPNSRAGQTAGNPFHEACMRIAKLIGLNLSINCVYDQQGRLANIIAGSLEDAFSAAIKACYQRLGFRWAERVDVSLASSYPHSHGIQFYKGLGTPDTITKARGAILLLAPMTSPIPEEFINAFRKVKEGSGPDPAAYVTSIMSQGRPFLTDQSAEFNMAMSVAIRRPPIRTILVSPMISRETATILGFEHAVTVEEGLRVLAESYPEARVAIFPSGGLTIPIAD